VGDGFDELE
jgi:hypothetical protein